MQNKIKNRKTKGTKFMKKTLSVFLAVLMLMGTFGSALSVFAMEEAEAQQQRVLVPGETVELTSDEEISFTYTPDNSGYYVFYSESDSDPKCYLYDADENELECSDDYDGRDFRILAYLEAGETYTFAVEWYNYDTYCNVTLEAHEIKSISFTPAIPYVFTLGVSDGYYTTRSVEDEETGESYEEEFYYFNVPSYRNGDTLTLNKTDGSSVEYVFDQDEWEFISEDGDTVDVDRDYDQYENPWTPDGEHNYITIRYDVFTCKVPVTVKPNPVASISFTPAEPYAFTEGISEGNYEMRTVYDEETEEEYEEEFYYYSFPGFAEGDVLTVNAPDGTKTDYVYGYNEEEYDSCFTSDNGEVVYADYNINQYDNPWAPGGEYNYFTVSYSGCKYNAPVEIYPNPVESISFTPVEDFMLIEGISSGYYDTRYVYDEETEEEYEEEFYRYNNPSMREGDILTANLADGTSVDYTYRYVEDEGYNFVSDEGEIIYVNRSDRQYYEHWVIGGEYNYFNLIYAGRRCNVPVTVTENPVASISFTPAEDYVLIEDQSDGYYDTRYEYDEENDEEYEEEYYYYYIPSHRQGDTLTVNMTDGTSVDYVYDYDEGEFLSADGEYVYIDKDEDQNSHPWVIDGEYNYFTVEYAGFECRVPVTVIADPVEGISFTPASAYVFTEGVSNGYYTYNWETDEETGEEYKDTYYYYYLPSFEQGDTLTVHMIDGTDVDYVFDEDEWEFISADGEYAYIETYNRQDYEHWTPDGEYNYFTIQYKNYSCKVPVSVTENPVESISFTPDEAYVLTEGLSDGYYDTRYVYDEETEEEYYEEYYYYYFDFERGDTLTVNYADGTSTDYVYGYCDVEDEYTFVAADGTTADADMYTDQEDKPLRYGEANYITVKYAGRECTVDVEVYPNPVESVSFTPAEPYVLYEGISGGYYDWYWEYDDETDEEYEKEYYYFYLPSRKNGDIFTVNYTDGTSVDYIFDEEEGEYISADGEYIEFSRYSDQDEYPWTVGGENNYFTVRYAHRTYAVSVEIRENPVSSFTFTPFSPYELTEGLSDGYYTTRWVYDEETDEEYEEAYYSYYTPEIEEEDCITVNYKDGSSAVYNYDRTDDEYEEETVYIFTSEDGDEIYVTLSFEQYEHPWVPDGDYNYFTLNYASHQYNVPLEIKANPVESISFTPVEDYVLFYGASDGEYVWDEFYDDEDEDSYFYRFDFPRFVQGDIFTVNKTDGTSVEYVFDEDEWEFISADGEYIEFDRYSNQDRDHWVIDGEYNFFTVEYAGRECTVPVEIIENPVESISFTPAEPYVLIEGMSRGYYNTRDVYDEETDEEYEEEYYHFYIPDYQDGDTLTVHMTDGTSVDYVYDEEEYEFISADGEAAGVSTDSNQYDNPWTPDGENNFFTVEYAGFECKVDVEIRENPVESISFTPAEAYRLVENYSDGEYDWREIYDEENDDYYEVEFYYYYTPDCKDGDTLTVNYTDGTSVDYVYDGLDFVSEDDEIVEVSTYSNQYSNPWVVGGEHNYFTVEHYGRRCEVPVEVTENPVESITFTPEMPYVLTEGISDGYYTTRDVYDDETDEEYEEKYYDFSTPDYQNGDILTVNYTDGTTVDYVFDEDEWEFVSADGEVAEVSRDSNQYDNPWKPDGKHNYFTIKHYGRECKVYVQIRPNPVESISFAPASPYVLTEGVSEGYYSIRSVEDEETGEEYEEEFFCYYLPDSKTGDVITVNYTDGTSVDYVYDVEEGEYVSADGESIYDNRDSNQLENPWTPDGENNFFTIEYAGRECKVPVAIKANPVKAISFTPVSSYTLTEALSRGYYDYRYLEDEETGEEYEEKFYNFYVPDFVEGDILTVTMKDNTTVKYVYGYSAENRGYYFISADGQLAYPSRESDQYENPWKPDGKHNYFSVSYAGFDYDVPVTIKPCTVESVSAVYKYPLYEGYDCELNSHYYKSYYERTTNICEDDIICTVTYKDGTKLVAPLNQVEETLDCYTGYSIYVEEIGENKGRINLGSIRGEFIINVEKDLPDALTPSSRCIAYGARVVEGEKLDLQLLKFADMGFEHEVRVISAPDGVSIDNDGRLTGTPGNRYSGRMHIALDVRWKNSHAHNVYSIPVYLVEKKDVVTVPASAKTAPFNEKVAVDYTGGEVQWYKFTAVRDYIGILTDKDVSFRKSVTLYDSKGRYVAYRYLDDRTADYDLCYGETYYIRLKNVDEFTLEVNMWMPEWDEERPSQTREPVLVGTNVEKQFEGDENTLWNVFRVDTSIEIDFGEDFIYQYFSLMERIASPVNIHTVTAKTESPNKIIHSESYKYDPNNVGECKKIGASTSQDTMADELLEGEKEYRFDNVYYLIPEQGKLIMSEERYLYVPVGYAIDGNHVVKCDLHKNTETKTEDVVAATCSKNGSYAEVVRCADCGKEISRTVKTTPKAAHTFNKKVTDKAHLVSAATYTSPAVYRYNCANCTAISDKLTFTYGNALTLGVTSKIVATQSANAIKLTWNKVAGATGYRVFQYNASTKKWVAIKTTAANTHTVTGLKAGTTYYYLVRAYVSSGGNIVWGENSAIFKTVTAPGVTSKIVATQSTNAIKLTWNKVAGATGYRVYQYNASTKKWVAIKTTAANTLTVAKLKAGTTYYFIVRAYTVSGGAVIWGANSATFRTSTKTATPTLKVASTRKGTATLAWSDVAGETGYQVYYSTSKTSGFKLYKNYAANTKAAVVSGLVSGRGYYFTVRTYVKTPNGYVFSAWSPILGVKVK